MSGSVKQLKDKIKMIGYKYNDGNRKQETGKGSAMDCVTRAISILTQKPYTEIQSHVSKLNLQRKGTESADIGVAKIDSRSAREHFGIVQVALPKEWKGKKPTYSQAYKLYGDCIVSTTHHICAIVDGYLQDTGDNRVYRFDFGNGPEIRERKARSIWVTKERAKEFVTRNGQLENKKREIKMVATLCDVYKKLISAGYNHEQALAIVKGN